MTWKLEFSYKKYTDTEVSILFLIFLTVINLGNRVFAQCETQWTKLTKSENTIEEEDEENTNHIAGRRKTLKSSRSWTEETWETSSEKERLYKYDGWYHGNTTVRNKTEM